MLPEYGAIQELHIKDIFMNQNKSRTILIILLFVFPFSISQLYAWSVHALINNPVLSNMDEVSKARPVTVRSLKSFLTKHESELITLLAKEEKWARENLDWYKPRPDELNFNNKDTKNIEQRFIAAIRVNPKVVSLQGSHILLLPRESAKGRPLIKATSLTFLKDAGDKEIRVVLLRNGESVSPIEVLNTASDEPDLGMDIGLFSDNNTEFGKIYGFGVQPFGNPNLPYGSQAPFHMGFYHEAGIINVLAGFLKQTYPEYRIHLYKTLSEFAFSKGEDYWGWRFMGWGLHYLGDLSQPYHSRALPGVGATRMVCINFLDIAGAARVKKDAIQIVSNRHMAIERFQNKLMQSEYVSGIQADSLFNRIKNPEEFPEYYNNYPREISSLKAEAMADDLDEALEDNMPEKLVSDPDFELSGSDEVERIIQEVEKAHGKKAVEKLKNMLVAMLLPNGSVTRAYVKSILRHKK